MAWGVTKRSDSGLPQIGSWLTLSEEVADDQDKLLDYDVDIKFGREAIIHALRIEYTSVVVTAATRPLRLQMRDSANDVIGVIDMTVEAADAAAGPADVTTTYEIARGLSPPSSPAATLLHEHDTLPDEFVLLPGQNLRIFALSGTDPLDDMILHVLLQVF